jgi:hypothetical protein
MDERTSLLQKQAVRYCDKLARETNSCTEPILL